MITVEYGIPIPTKRGNSRKGPVPKYPFASLEVGGSFVVAAELASLAAGAARSFKHNHPGWDYATILHEDGTRRIWRTA